MTPLAVNASMCGAQARGAAEALRTVGLNYAMLARLWKP
jgi:hypothetical protein